MEPLVPASQIRREDGTVDAIPDKDSGLIEIKRLYRPDLSRFGMVVRLTDIWCPVDVVPAFGESCDKDWTCDTAVDEARRLFINIFYTKDAYRRLS